MNKAMKSLAAVTGLSLSLFAGGYGLAHADSPGNTPSGTASPTGQATQSTSYDSQLAAYKQQLTNYKSLSQNRGTSTWTSSNEQNIQKMFQQLLRSWINLASQKLDSPAPLMPPNPDVQKGPFSQNDNQDATIPNWLQQVENIAGTDWQDYVNTYMQTDLSLTQSMVNYGNSLSTSMQNSTPNNLGKYDIATSQAASESTTEFNSIASQSILQSAGLEPAIPSLSTPVDSSMEKAQDGVPLTPDQITAFQDSVGSYTDQMYGQAVTHIDDLVATQSDSFNGFTQTVMDGQSLPTNWATDMTSLTTQAQQIATNLQQVYYLDQAAQSIASLPDTPENQAMLSELNNQFIDYMSSNTDMTFPTTPDDQLAQLSQQSFQLASVVNPDMDAYPIIDPDNPIDTTNIDNYINNPDIVTPPDDIVTPPDDIVIPPDDFVIPPDDFGGGSEGGGD